MRGRCVFVTGTDTGVGKTLVTLGLLRALRDHGLQAVGMKPVASGAEFLDGRWVNEDAEALRLAGSVLLAYEQVNPFVFGAPASPHIAAALEGRSIHLPALVEACRGLAAMADAVLVEGVGGWMVPLNDRETVADLALMLGFPIVLVVPLRLGCLNHARLTRDAIRNSGCRLAGWVANRIDPSFAHATENLETLVGIFGAPPLGLMPWRGSPDDTGNMQFDELKKDEILRALVA